MKIFKLFQLFSLCIILEGCNSDDFSIEPLMESQAEEWAGAWNNETQFLQIKRNGYGEWTSIDLERGGMVILEGNITISDTMITLVGTTLSGKGANGFKIQEPPHVEININGEPIITTTLDGDIFIKDF